MRVVHAENELRSAYDRYAAPRREVVTAGFSLRKSTLAGRGCTSVGLWSCRCASEAETAFGDAAVFVEAYVDRARHVEVQVLGDAAGRVMALGDRDCSVQVTLGPTH